MRYLFFLFLLAINSMGQVDSLNYKAPEIELPDFIITKISKVDLPTQNKETPDLISPLSQQFILPRISVTELGLEGLFPSYKITAEIYDSVLQKNISILAGSGRYTLPIAELFYSDNIEKKHNYYINARFLNTTDFIPNAGNNELKLGAGTSFIIKKYRQAPARLLINGLYERKSLKNYAAEIPEQRVYNSISATASFENLFFREFNINFGGDFLYSSTNLSNTSYFHIKPFFNLKSDFETFDLTIMTEPVFYRSYQKEQKNEFIIQSDASIGIHKLFDYTNLRIGFKYSSKDQNSKTFIGPYSILELLLVKNLVLKAHYINELNYVNPVELINHNPYLDTFSIKPRIEKLTNRAGISAIFYFDRKNYIEAGFSNYSIDNFRIFSEPVKSGLFNIYSINAKITEIKASANLTDEKLGNFNGEFFYKNSKLKESNSEIPFTPKYTLNLYYSYKFDFLLYFILNFSYNSSMFTNINNDNSVPYLLNAGITIEYPIKKNIILGLKAENIFNKNNYIWSNYPLKPFDLTGYIKINY